MPIKTSGNMKTIFHALLLPIASLTVVGCSESSENPALPSQGTRLNVSFTAEQPPVTDAETRTVIEIDESAGSFVSRWSDGDIMTLLYGTTPVPAAYDSATRKFATELTADGPQSACTFAPHLDGSYTGERFTIPFGNARTQQGNSFNYMYDPLLSAATNFDPATDEPVFDMTRLTSILKFEITTEESIRTVLLTMGDGEVISSSAFHANTTDGTGQCETAAAADTGVSPASNVIALNYEDGTEPTGLAEAYFNIPAGTYASLQVDLITTDGKIAGRRLATGATFEAGALHRLKIQSPTFRDTPQPALSWPGQDMDATHDITTDESGSLTYDAAITISAPAGIAALWVDVTSDVLNGTDSDGDGVKDGITRLDLFNESSILGSIPYSMLGLNCTTQVQYKKSTLFDITGLVPLIMSLGPVPGALHVFEVHVIDLAGQECIQALTFRTPEAAPTLTYDGNADAWANTATLTVANLPETATDIHVQYRKAGTQTWQEATGSGNGTWQIAATWNKVSENPDKWQPDNTTGIFAGDKGYEGRLLNTAAAGVQQTVPGDNTPAIGGSSIPTVSNASLSCYTTSNASTAFWGSGNNTASTSLGKTDKLCTYDAPYAWLAAQQALSILAPGNLFTGTFDFVYQGFLGASSYGTVNFGQKYDYGNARPTALQLTYKASFGTTWMKKWEDANHTSITSGQDQASIIVCIIDWDARHSVTSGNNAAPTGGWNPETLTGLSESEKAGLIAYGTAYPAAATTTDTVLTIPLFYYDKEAAMPAGNYTIIISCATNRYGEYLNGTQNNLYVTDFKWVY